MVGGERGYDDSDDRLLCWVGDRALKELFGARSNAVKAWTSPMRSALNTMACGLLIHACCDSSLTVGLFRHIKIVTCSEPNILSATKIRSRHRLGTLWRNGELKPLFFMASAQMRTGTLSLDLAALIIPPSKHPM